MGLNFSKEELLLTRFNIQPLNIILYRESTTLLSSTMNLDARLAHQNTTYASGNIMLSEFNRIGLAVPFPSVLKNHPLSNELAETSNAFLPFIFDQLALIQREINYIPVLNPFYNHNHSWLVQSGWAEPIGPPIDTDEIVVFEARGKSIECKTLTSVIIDAVNITVRPIDLKNSKNKGETWIRILKNLNSWLIEILKIQYGKCELLTPLLYQTDYFINQISSSNYLSKELDITFDLIDSNGNGYVDMLELKDSASKLNSICNTKFTPEEIEIIFKKGDLNNDQLISREEFHILWGSVSEKFDNLKKYSLEIMSAIFIDLTLRKIGLLDINSVTISSPALFVTDLFNENSSTGSLGFLFAPKIPERYRIRNNPHAIIMD